MYYSKDSNLNPTYSFSLPQPNKVFIKTKNKNYRYGVIYQLSHILSTTIKPKLHSNDVIVLFLKDPTLLTQFISALWLSSILFSVINPKISLSQLIERLSDIEPKILFFDQPNIHITELYSHTTHIEARQFIDDHSLSHSPVVTPQLEHDTKNKPAIIVYTSGSTQKAKKNILQRHHILAAARSCSSILFGSHSNQLWMLALPLDHIGGLNSILKPMIYGHQIYIPSNQNISTISQLLQFHPINGITCVPTQLYQILTNESWHPNPYLHILLLGGGPCSDTLIKKALERNISLFISYGLTETCGMITARKPTFYFKEPKLVGKALPPNQIYINSKGFIMLKGPQVVYPNTSSQWLKTEDLGSLNEAQELTIYGRKSTLVISGGKNINTTDIENHLQQIYGIDGAYCYGIPDEKWGEKLIAFIETKNPDITCENIIKILKETLLPYQIPKTIYALPSFPRTSLGKIDTPTLKTYQKKCFQLKLSHQ